MPALEREELWRGKSETVRAPVPPPAHPNPERSGCFYTDCFCANAINNGILGAAVVADATGGIETRKKKA